VRRSAARCWLVCAIVAAIGPAAPASEADAILPESFSAPQPLRLNDKSARQAEAIARYLQSIFEEETDGPDKAVETKRKVLQLDPAFTGLAIEVAHQYLRHGETAEAISVLKDASKAAPADATPALALAAIYLRQLQKPDLAEKNAQQALAASPESAAAYETLWEIYRTTSQPQKLDALFQRALKQKDAGAAFWLSMAELRARESAPGAAARAEPFLALALERAGEDASLLSRIADCYASCGAADKAAPLYRRALAQRTNLGGVREKLATCLLRLGDTTEAIKLLEDIVAANPLDLGAYDQIAQLHLAGKNFPKALANLRQAILLAPSDPRRHDDVIRLSIGTGDMTGALDAATEAEKRFPKHIEFTVYRARILSESKRHEESLKAFEQAQERAEKGRRDLLDSDFFFSYGAAAEQAGNPAKAVELLRKSIELDPEKAARACNYLGYMWAERNENLDEAVLLVRRALDSEPDNGAYLDTLGWIYFRQGKFQEALVELLHAAELLPGPDGVVFEHIGDTYQKLGKSVEAVLYWQKALREDPSSTTLPAKLDAHSSRVVQQPKPAGERQQP